jgi:putative hemolysin
MQTSTQSPWHRIPAAIGRLLGLRSLERDYLELAGIGDLDEFLHQTLERFQIRPVPGGMELGKVPRSGPLLVVSNHPFGAIEGIALAAVLRRVRPDLKVMANRFLGSIPELRPLFFLVDSFGGAAGHRQSQVGLRGASQWLAEGHALLCFPAGAVSHLHARERVVRDPQWNEAPARLALRHSARVLPIWIEGRNSNLFQAAGVLAPALRTLLLPRELDRCRGQKLRIELGRCVETEELQSARDARQATDFLRLRCEILRGRDANQPLHSVKEQQQGQPIAPPSDLLRMQREVSALETEGAQVFGNTAFQVFAAKAGSIPALFHEITRLREITFRAVGEGTREALDRDRYDEHYTHLVLWDRECRRVAGSYRLAATDEVLTQQGIDGLYTSSLFQYRPEFFQKLGPAWELGRSFVRQEYQRSFWPLLALWKGIAQLVMRDPRRARLFGAASMSAQYSPASRALVTTWLREHRAAADFEGSVRARTPPQASRHEARFRGKLTPSADPGLMVSELEADGKGIPVLLREYLRIGARVADLHVDMSFGNTLDALVLIDLLKSDARILARYFEVEGVRELYRAHQRACPLGQPTLSAPCSRASG